MDSFWEYLKKQWTKLASIISFISAMSRFLVIFPIYIVIFLITIGLCFLFAPFFYNRYFKFEKLYKNFPYQHYIFLCEFLQNVGLLSKINEKDYDNIHHISKLTKNFSITNYDSILEVTFEGENIKDIISDRFKVRTGGGSSIDFKNLNMHYYDLMNNPNEPLNPELYKDTDRCKYISLPFTKGVKKGASFKIQFKNEWKGAMRLETDGLIYYEPIIYKEGIGEITSIIKFNRKILIIHSYSINLTNGQFQSEHEQPKNMPELADKEFPFVYLWEKPNPELNKLYLIIYTSTI